MIAKLVSELNAWLASGESIALATVVGAEGPSPRPVGSLLAVTGSGKMIGSVSGGCVEGAVFQEAQEVLEAAAPRRLTYGTTDQDGWDVGLACGGTIEIYVEALSVIHHRLLTALQANEMVALITALHGEGHLLVWPDGRMEGESRLAMETAEIFAGPPTQRYRCAGGECFLQVFGPLPTLTIIGAVHLAQPLVQLAQVMGFWVRVVDGRRLFATRERFPTADELIVAWPQKGLSPTVLRSQDALVVLTHDPKFDLPALEIALRSPVGYIGLLGSKTTQAQRRTTLATKGFTEQEMARIQGPVGLDLGGREPEEIALAIMAEIVAVRYGKEVSGRRFEDAAESL